MPKKKTRVLVMGLGELGCATARSVLSEPSLSLVGVVELREELVGRPLTELLDDPRAARRRVLARLEEAPPADAVVMTTTSRVRQIAPDILDAVKRGLHVVTSCEEMSHPWSADPRWARRIDRAARAAGVTVLGTGVNPGFVLDRFALSLASATLRVERVIARRLVDLATRRRALREKMMVGATPAEFARARREGRVGHVGLEASARLIAEGLGWKLDRFAERLEPVLAQRRLRGPGYDVPPGSVAGTRHEGMLLGGDDPRVLLHLEMRVDARGPHDAVRIEGPVPVEAVIAGGLPGEAATVATLLRGVSALGRLSPGIATPADLPAAPVGR